MNYFSLTEPATSEVDSEHVGVHSKGTLRSDHHQNQPFNSF